MYNHKQKKKIVCPRCGRTTRVQVTLNETHLWHSPLWCEKCKSESVVDFDGVSQNPSRSEPTA